MADEVKKDIVEIAADGVADGMHIVGEEALAAEELVRSVDRLQLSHIALGVAAGAAAGALIAFRIAYKKAELKYEKILEEEIEQMRDHFQAKEQARAEQAAKVQPLREKVEELGYTSPEPAPEAPPETPVVEVPPVNNVFERATPVIDAWDQDAEEMARAQLQEGVQFVIHRDEVGKVDGYDLMTLTYYEMDDVLSDPQDQAIDQDEIVGLQNMDKFGHGSGDAQVVFVRNPEREMEYEVIKTPRSYAQEVHGFDPDIRHANPARGRLKRGFPDDE